MKRIPKNHTKNSQKKTKKKTGPVSVGLEEVNVGKFKGLEFIIKDITQSIVSGGC